MAYGFVIDLEKCSGCHACTLACKAANGTPPHVTRARVVKTYEGTYPKVERIIRPMLCMMCENPPCVEVCPQEGATYKREEDGIVVIDKEKCIGCQMCVSACPYGARYYIADKNGYFGEELNEYESMLYANMPEKVVDKCDFCLEYNGGTPDPVCVKACQHEARLFGDLDELQSVISARKGEPYLSEEGTNPHVYYLPVVKV